MKLKFLLILTISVVVCFAIGITVNRLAVDNETSKEESAVEDTQEQTRYVYEEPSLETNEVFDETYAEVESLYSETESYVNRFPDYDLPDIEGYEKDAYGNYIITEQMFIDKFLPVNEDGVIEYISYFDENGIMLNPMPTYYNNYLQYFAVDGG